MGTRFGKVTPRNTKAISNEKTNERVNPILVLLKSIFASFAFTVIILMLLAFFLLTLGLTEKIVSIAVIVIYVAASFVAGFLSGKKLKVRRFLWGFAEGVSYFLILFLVSVILNGVSDVLADSVFTTFVLCAGGMLGGMLS